MPIRLYKRPNGIYHLRGTVQGERVDRSARTHSREEAEQVRAKIEAEIFRAHVYGEQSVKTFPGAVKDYIAAGGEDLYLDTLSARIGMRRVQDVTQRLVNEIASERNVAPATLIRQIYTPVAAVLNHVRPEGTAKISFRKPKVRTARTDYLTPAQAEAWISALQPYLARLVTFYLATGCRASEALNLDWKDVSPEAERVVFWDTKADYPRGVNLIERARLALPPRSEGQVFRTKAGKPWHGYDAINLMLKRTREKRPDLAPIHCHLLRHTWATWAYAMTRDLTFVMQQGGWRSLGMVGRYTHVGSADLASAAIALGWEIPGRSDFGRRPDQANSLERLPP